MQKLFSTALGAWIAYVALLLVLSRGLVDFPCWTDPFYSSWAQTLGAVGAVYAAFRVGQEQLRAADKVRESELEDERLSALRFIFDALIGAMPAMQILCSDLDQPKSRQAMAVWRIEQSIEIVQEPLRMRISANLRSRALIVRSAAQVFIQTYKRSERPFNESDRKELFDQKAQLEAIFKPVQRLLRQAEGLRAARLDIAVSAE